MQSSLTQGTQDRVEHAEEKARAPVPATGHLNSGRRKFITFAAVLAALLILAFALLKPIGTMLLAAPQALVEQQSSAIGSRTLERLLSAESMLRLAGAQITGNTALTGLPSSMTLEAFSSVAVTQNDIAPVMLKGNQSPVTTPDAQMLTQLRSGKTGLMVTQSGSDIRLGLARAFDSGELTPPTILVAELAPDYLWRTGEQKQDAYRVCVRDIAGAPVFCQQPGNLAQAGGMVGWLVSGEQPAAQSEIAIAQHFAGSDWNVTVTASPAAGTTPALAAIIYIGAAILCLSLALVLTSVLTRRSADNASAITPPRSKRAQEKFSPPQANEKGQGARQPREQAIGSDSTLESLRLFSEIDRAILSGASFERIVESVLPRIHALLPGSATAIVLLDRETPRQCKIMMIGPDGEHQNNALEDALDSHSVSRLGDIPDGDWFDSKADDPLLAPFHELGINRCMLLPIYRDAIAGGVLMLSNGDQATLEKSDLALARDMAHRLGVAYTSAMRGKELLFHSLYDSKTELPNRKYFETRLAEEISRARRESRQLGLLLIDLDDFKKVNTIYGHQGGDIVLEQASTRLKECLRTEDIAARVGSDEFAVVSPTIASATDASNVAKKLIDTLSEPYMVAGREHHLSATIGIAVFPYDGKSPESLLHCAEFALHAAKRDGGAAFQLYEAQSNEEARYRSALSSDLRQAIEKKELMLYFQPQIDLRRGEIVAAEALLRWQHRTRGLIMPDEFISIAEKSDLIEHIGDFVRERASAQFRQWEAEGNAPLRVAVNVSSRELKNKNFYDKIEQTLVSSGLRPFSLELEITESMLLDRSPQVLDVLQAISQRGVRIAIDDFGTGYSSMAYLKDIPFHVLKIDRSFIRNIGTEDGSDSIISAILGVAKGLRKEIVAEGIETEAQRAFLAENGCDMAQGFLWSRAVPADEFVTFVKNWNETARRLATV